MGKPEIQSSILGLDKPPYVTEEYVKQKVAKIEEICALKTGKIADKQLLIKAISLIDLTSLNADDTTEIIEKLCAKAIYPIGENSDNRDLHTAAVCIFQARAQDAIDILRRENIRDIAVATVAGNFPTALHSYNSRLDDVIAAEKLDVDEIDIVIDRSLVKSGHWEELFKQISAMRRACGTKHMKTILSTGDLPSIDHIYSASMVAMSAGSDFIKTSTGKETVNATLEVGIVMCEAIKAFEKLSGRRVGLKPAGGIKTAQQAVQWLTLVEENLGIEWVNKELFRIGASSLLDDLVQTVNKL